MNSNQAKQIPIENFLWKLGHKPAKISGSDLWYHSPLKEKDKTPSFKVNTKLNTFYDFSIDSGWTIIDLVSEMYSENVRGALAILGKEHFWPTYRSSANTNNLRLKTPAEEKKKQVIELLHIKPLNNPILLDYLKTRCISLKIAQKYLVEAYFKIGERKNFALAFKNDAGWYEIRNKHFKWFLGAKKTVSRINFVKGGKSAVFEWFMDFLSYLTYFKIDNYQSSALIMNSTSLFDETIELINQAEFEQVYLFLDNDETGTKTAVHLNENINSPVIDKSGIYSGSKDFNKFLCDLKR